MDNNSGYSAEKILFRDYKILNGTINTPDDFKYDSIEGFKQSLDFSNGFNIEKKLARADLIVKLITVSNTEQNESDATYHFVFVFEITNLDEMITKKEDGTIQVDKLIGNALASIAYGTTRGILITRLSGTPFQNFILPVIDPNQLLDSKSG